MGFLALSEEIDEEEFAQLIFILREFNLPREEPITEYITHPRGEIVALLIHVMRKDVLLHCLEFSEEVVETGKLSPTVYEKPVGRVTDCHRCITHL